MNLKKQILNKLLEIYNSNAWGFHIYEEPKFIFIHLYKNAGSSIKSSLRKRVRNDLVNRKPKGIDPNKYEITIIISNFILF